MTTVEILTTARDLVAKGWSPGRIGGGCEAEDKLGNVVGALSKRATRFHSFLALIAAMNCDDPLIISKSVAAGLVRESMCSRLICDLDLAPNRTQAEVVAAFDKAIDLAKQEPAS